MERRVKSRDALAGEEPGGLRRRALPCLPASPLANFRRLMEIDTSTLPDSTLLQREGALGAWLATRAPIAIGFSGGVDSAYLAVAARLAVGPEGVLAIIGRSASYPE